IHIGKNHMIIYKRSGHFLISIRYFSGAYPGEMSIKARYLKHFMHNTGIVLTVSIFFLKNSISLSGNKPSKSIFKSNIFYVLLGPVIDGFYFIKVAFFIRSKLIYQLNQLGIGLLLIDIGY